MRRAGWQRVGFGVHRRTAVDDAWRADLHAWQEVLPPAACFTHLTGAALLELWLPGLLPEIPVVASMRKADVRPKRPELVVIRHTKPIEWSWQQSLRTAAAHEVLLTCARHLALLDLVVLGDSALHRRLTSREEIRLSASRRRWGSTDLLRALDWMDGRSESAWESLLRVLHRSRMLHEYDGAVHRDAVTHRHDLDRDRRLLDIDWRRRGYTASDLLHRPDRILAEADATLGRRRRVDRLDVWAAMVRESLLHRIGRRTRPPHRLASRRPQWTAGSSASRTSTA